MLSPSENKTKSSFSISAKRRAKTTPLIGFLRSTTCPFIHGIKTKKSPVYCCNKETLLRDHFAGGRKWYRHSLSNWRYERHLEGKDTYYFVGNPNQRDSLSLVLIDIDCHKYGTLGTAKQFAAYLNTHLDPTIPFEVSTHGNGMHGYFLIDKGNSSIREINTALKAFESHLQNLLIDSGIDVENVEIKGMLPEGIFENGTLIAIKYPNALAKLPRTLSVEELESSPIFTIPELHKNKGIVKVLSLIPLGAIPGSQQGCRRSSAVETSAYASKNKKHEGSVSGKLFSDRDLQQLPLYRQYAESVLKGELLFTSNQKRIVVEDIAIALLICICLQKHPNLDSSVPTARIKALWDSLKNNNDISRGFSYNRLGIIIKLFDSLGFIEWHDKTYSHSHSPDGKGKGKARRFTFRIKINLPSASQAEGSQDSAKYPPNKRENLYYTSIDSVFGSDKRKRKMTPELTKRLKTLATVDQLAARDPCFAAYVQARDEMDSAFKTLFSLLTHSSDDLETNHEPQE